jgi:hypothetical protein
LENSSLILLLILKDDRLDQIFKNLGKKIFGKKIYAAINLKREQQKPLTGIQ